MDGGESEPETGPKPRHMRRRMPLSTREALSDALEDILHLKAIQLYKRVGIMNIKGRMGITSLIIC